MLTKPKTPVLRTLLYFSVFISLLIMVRSYTFKVFSFFHGYLESILLTGAVVAIIEISGHKFTYIKSMTGRQNKWLLFGSYGIFLALLAYTISSISITENGGMESSALYTFQHFQSWSGNEVRKSYSPMVGFIGFALTVLAVFQIKSPVFLQKNIAKKALTFLPIILFYALLYVRHEYISIPVFRG